MDVTRFDKEEYQVLDCTKHGMYAPEGPLKDRALLMMEEGILAHNSYDEWWRSGWKLTTEGMEYYQKFMELVLNKHGHVWMTNRDTNPDMHDEDDAYGKEVDTFAYSVGHHNGPVCKNCGYSFCQHCTCEFDVEECTDRRHA